jgi:hypothetical protein
MIIATALFTFMLFQSCSLSRKCREAGTLSKAQADEISIQKLQLEKSEQEVVFLNNNIARLQDENRYLESENRLLLEKVQEMNNEYANFEWVKELPLSTGTPLDSRPSPAIVNNPVALPDTVSLPVIGINSGNLAFYCPRKVNYKEPFTAIGFIADVISDEKVREQLLERVREVERDPDRVRLSDDNMLVKKIQFYKLIELRLDESGNGAFGIKKMHSEDKQEVSDKMEGWQWKVTPLSQDQRQELVLKVIVYDANGKVDYAFNKTHFIDIEVRSFAFFHNMKMQFVNNPEWAYGSVILPFITFLYGNYRGRRKQKAGPAEEPAKVEAA